MRKKLCKFTARVRDELTKIRHISPLTTSYRPCTDLNLSHPGSQPLLPLRHFSLKSSIFVWNLNQIDSTFCKTYTLTFYKISGEITTFVLKCGDFCKFIAYSSGEHT